MMTDRMSQNPVVTSIVPLIFTNVTILNASLKLTFVMGKTTAAMDPMKVTSTLAVDHHSDALMANGNVLELLKNVSILQMSVMANLIVQMELMKALIVI